MRNCGSMKEHKYESDRSIEVFFTDLLARLHVRRCSRRKFEFSAEVRVQYRKKSRVFVIACEELVIVQEQKNANYNDRITNLKRNSSTDSCNKEQQRSQSSREAHDPQGSARVQDQGRSISHRFSHKLTVVEHSILRERVSEES